jgi:hypothetical protein
MTADFRNAWLLPSDNRQRYPQRPWEAYRLHLFGAMADCAALIRAARFRSHAQSQDRNSIP